MGTLTKPCSSTTASRPLLFSRRRRRAASRPLRNSSSRLSEAASFARPLLLFLSLFQGRWPGGVSSAGPLRFPEGRCCCFCCQGPPPCVDGRFDGAAAATVRGMGRCPREGGAATCWGWLTGQSEREWRLVSLHIMAMVSARRWCTWIRGVEWTTCTCNGPLEHEQALTSHVHKSVGFPMLTKSIASLPFQTMNASLSRKWQHVFCHHNRVTNLLPRC